LVNNDGVVSKKKLVESAKPVAFRSVPIIRVKEELQATSHSERSPSDKPRIDAPVQEAKLIIEQPEVKKQITNKEQGTGNKEQGADQLQTTNNKPSSTGISSLARIRQKVSEQNKNNGNDIKELTEEELYVAWGAFIEKLVIRKNHSAVTNFKMATLRVIDNNTLEIVTGNNIQQKFIEQERADLVEHLQSHFCNRQLIYSVIIEETEYGNQPVERTLSSKEQYLKIIEEYPLVKELKDRLKLELDY
jgi:DNA polymerase-3 subunit gamma/tau